MLRDGAVSGSMNLMDSRMALEDLCLKAEGE
jgi:hypothetical protein